MSHDSNALPTTITRRHLLEKSTCAVAALTTPQWLLGCGADSGEGSGAAGRSDGTETQPLRASLPKRVAGIRIPDSRLAQAAADLALSASPETLYNHCLRTYLFAALSFERGGVRFDEELVFVASALHDLGLVDAYMTPNERFEVDGADAALRFLERWRVPARWAEKVWDAIALHTSVGIVTRKPPEISGVSMTRRVSAWPIWRPKTWPRCWPRSRVSGSSRPPSRASSAIAKENRRRCCSIRGKAWPAGTSRTSRCRFWRT